MVAGGGDVEAPLLVLFCSHILMASRACTGGGEQGEGNIDSDGTIGCTMASSLSHMIQETKGA